MTFDAGLCAGCAWSQPIESARGSTFLRCGRAGRDPGFPKYPRLPVRACRGFEPRAESPAAGSVSEFREPAHDRATGTEWHAPATPPIALSDRFERATLFERIGGRATVERLIDDFYDRIERDDVLRPIFPDDLAEGRERQKLFMEEWLGGERRYSARFGHPRLRMRHFPFVIDERAAGRWLRRFRESLHATGVPEPAASEIMGRLAPLARHMVNADDDVPREPPAGDVLT